MFEVIFAYHKEIEKRCVLRMWLQLMDTFASNEAKFIQYEHMYSNAVILKIPPILSRFNRRLDGW